MMKKIGKSKLIKNFISFLIPLFLLEVLFRLLSDMAIFDWALLRIFISSTIISLIVSILMSLASERVGKIFSSIILFVATIYAIAQAGFANFLGVYISLGTSSQLGAVKEYVKDYIASFNPAFYTMLIPFILYVLYKCLLEKRIFKSGYNNKMPFTKRTNRLVTLVSIVVVILCCFFYKYTLTADFMQNDLQLESTAALFKNPTNLNISVNQFGTSLFGMLDVKTTINKPEEEIIEHFEKEEIKEEDITEYTRLMDDTDWEKLDSRTKNNTYKTLNSYFMSRSISDKNEYTGLLEGKNVIVIMMESVGEIFINPDYYPTFYKLYTEGWSFSNSYSPRNSCATMNNEMSGMISLFSIYRNCTANDHRYNQYFESIFNVFNRAGYKTSSYHNYDETYYARSTIHKNMGSKAYYGVQDLKIPYSWVYKEWPSDVALMQEAMKRIDTKKPFMAWITTVTSHQPYNVSSEYGDKHLGLFKSTHYSIEAKRYMSKLKELDLALDKLLKILEEKKVLDDTVIVLYGDHYPYGLDNGSIKKVLGSSVLERHNIEKTPFVIYNPSLKAQNFTQYTSYMNILPTIANLFNLDYDPRLYMGEDILSENYVTSYKNRVVFADGSWESAIGSYNATNGKMTYFGEERYTNEEIISYNKEINDMIKMSNLAITSNYFKYLNDGLKEIKKEEEALIKASEIKTAE